MKKPSLTQNFYSYLLAAQQWYLKTPERSLDEAYKAALAIKAIEDEYFNGNKIVPESANYGNSTMGYFQSELKKQLKLVRMRLTEFKASRSIFKNTNQTITKLARNDGTNPTNDSFAIQLRNSSALTLEKLRFIDEVTEKYLHDEKNAAILVTSPQATATNPPAAVVNKKKLTNDSIDKQTVTKVDDTGVLPRSIFNTINRLQFELDPKAEEKFVKSFRNSQKRTLISVRIILLLIIVPFLTQQLSKHLIVGPIVDSLKAPNSEATFLNYAMEEKAIEEMQKFSEKIRFENLLTETRFSAEEIENQMREKVQELVQEYGNESVNAIKNIFADLLSLAAFSCLLITSRREIEVLKDFMDNIIYGLSDSAKAFIIILFTDLFVGFHSTHGWEVLLESMLEHFGLPPNRGFIFLFIATFPVILDAIFKYWIFRYLNRISPSAVATYRNMNE